MMQYNFKKLEIVADSVSDIKIPDVNDRVIEKRGHVITFSLNQVLENTRVLEKTMKEIEAKKELESAKMINIEGFHPFVKELSEQDLHTAYMYQQSKTLVTMCEAKAKEITEQMENDAKEVKEIKAQIPELNIHPAVEEAVKIINEN